MNPPRGAWAVAGFPTSRGVGGAIRASLLFEPLAVATAASRVRGDPSRGVALSLTANAARGRRTILASSRLVSTAFRHVPGSLLDLRVIDLADHPVQQTRALGLDFEPNRERVLTERFEFAIRAFEHIVTVSESCIDLWGLPRDRVTVVSNGSDTVAIRRCALPQRPVIGVASGAAPGRGLELLVEAARIVHDQLPDARLNLALATTGEASRRYLRAFRERVSSMAWIDVRENLRFDQIDGFLTGITLVGCTLPPGPYFDAALPVKLFDALSAGRPIVTTPRTESARLVASRNVGLVADDSPEGVADRMLALLADPARLTAMSVRARMVAETEFDLRVLGASLIDTLVEAQAGGAGVSRPAKL